MKSFNFNIFIFSFYFFSVYIFSMQKKISNNPFCIKCCYLINTMFSQIAKLKDDQDFQVWIYGNKFNSFDLVKKCGERFINVIQLTDKKSNNIKAENLFGINGNNLCTITTMQVIKLIDFVYKKETQFDGIVFDIWGIENKDLNNFSVSPLDLIKFYLGTFIVNGLSQKREAKIKESFIEIPKFCEDKFLQDFNAESNNKKHKIVCIFRSINSIFDCLAQAKACSNESIIVQQNSNSGKTYPLFTTCCYEAGIAFLKELNCPNSVFSFDNVKFIVDKILYLKTDGDEHNVQFNGQYIFLLNKNFSDKQLANVLIHLTYFGYTKDELDDVIIENQIKNIDFNKYIKAGSSTHRQFFIDDVNYNESILSDLYLDGIRDSFKIAKDNAWIDFYKKENSSIDDNFNFTVIFYQKDLAKQYIKMKKNILGWTHVTLKINNIEKSLDEYFK